MKWAFVGSLLGVLTIVDHAVDKYQRMFECRKNGEKAG